MKRPDYVKLFQKYIDWLDTPDDEKLPKTKQGFANYHNLSVQTLCNWDKRRGEVNQDEITIFLNHVAEMAIKPGAQVRWAELYAKLKGLLIEKSEQKVTIGLSADEIARRNFEAERRSREFREGTGYGVEDLPARSALLHN